MSGKAGDNKPQDSKEKTLKLPPGKDEKWWGESNSLFVGFLILFYFFSQILTLLVRRITLSGWSASPPSPHCSPATGKSTSARFGRFCRRHWRSTTSRGIWTCWKVNFNPHMDIREDHYKFENLFSKFFENTPYC